MPQATLTGYGSLSLEGRFTVVQTGQRVPAPVPGKAAALASEGNWADLRKLMCRVSRLRSSTNFAQPPRSDGCMATISYGHASLAQVFVPGGYRGMSVDGILSSLEEGGA